MGPSRLSTCLLLVLMTGTYGCHLDHAGPACPEIEAARAQLLLDKRADLQFLDVRTAPEFYAGHLYRASWLAIDDLDRLNRQLRGLDPEAGAIVYCRSGGPRSEQACQILHDAGFREVYRLAGGYLAWPEPR